MEITRSSVKQQSDFLSGISGTIKDELLSAAKDSFTSLAGDYVDERRSASGGNASTGESSSTGRSASARPSLGSRIASAGLDAVVSGGVSIGLDAAGAALEYIITRQERLIETSGNLRTEYAAMQSGISAGNAEMAATTERIGELSRKSDPTVSEKAELEGLKAHNKELDKKLTIEKQLAKTKGLEAEKAAIKAIGTKTERMPTNARAGRFTTTTLADDTKNKINEIKEVSAHIDELKAKQAKYAGSDDEKDQKQYKTLGKNIASCTKQYDKLNGAVAENIEFLSEQGQGISGATKDGKKFQKELAEVNDEYYTLAQSQRAPEAADLIVAQQRLASQYQSGSISLEEYVIKLNDLNMASKEYSSGVYGLVTANEYLTSVLQQVAVGHSLSKEEIDSLIAHYPTLQSAIYQTADGWSIEQGAVVNLIDQIKILQISYLTANKAMSDALAGSGAQRQAAIRQEFDTIAGIAQAYANLTGQDPAATKSLASGLTVLSHVPFMEKSSNEALGRMFSAELPPKTNPNPPPVAAPRRISAPSAPAVKDTKDYWLEDFNKQYETLRHQRTMDEISAEKYYADLTVLNGKYFKDKEKYLSEYRRYEEEIYKGGSELYNARKQNSLNWIEDRNDNKDWGSDDEISAYNRMLAYTKEYYSKRLISHEEYLESMRDLTKKKIDAIQAGYEKQLDDRQKVLEKQKDGMEEIIDLTVELIKQEKNDEIDKLKDKVIETNKLIEAKKESLRLTEKELSYQDEVDSQVKDIAKLQSRADLLALDDSREAQAQRADLLDEIAEKQKELNQYQHEEAVSNTEDALDKQAELFEAEKQEEIDEIENYLSQSGALNQAAMNRIDAEGQDLYGKLAEYNMIYGDGIRTSLESAWESARAALNKYGDALAAVTGIDHDLDLIEKEKEDPKGNMTEESRNYYINLMKQNAQRWKDYPAERKFLSEQSKSWGDMIGAYRDERTGVWYTDTSMKQRLFHSGLAKGFVGGQSTLQQNEVYALLTKDELVLNKPDQLKLGGRLKLAEVSARLLNEFHLNPGRAVSGAAGGITLKINAPVTITGNADQNTIKELNKFGSKLADTAINRLNAAFGKNGFTISPAINAIKS